MAQWRGNKSGQLGQQYFSAWQVRESREVFGGQRLAVQHATFENQGGGGFGEITQYLGGRGYVPSDPGNCGGTDQKLRQ